MVKLNRSQSVNVHNLLTSGYRPTHLIYAPHLVDIDVILGLRHEYHDKRKSESGK